MSQHKRITPQGTAMGKNATRMAALRQERDGIDRVIELERLLAEERERTQQLLRTITALRLTVTVNCDRVLQLIEKMEGKQ